ncbi:MAG TPA: BCAM0308 family protein [Burkholderiaceae bacterium]|nr:BCAM0308 family protein [Burkholderiaceae bacterium]
MKTVRDGWRPLQRLELRDELVHDTYKSKKRLTDPTRCPRCSAVYRDGRWQWASAPAGAREELCPACHRIQDHLPAGYVTLAGEFLAAHRDDVLQLVHDREAREKADHPLERIMSFEDAEDGVSITTTGIHPARSIGEAVYAAYKGHAEYHYNKQENLLRVRWMR